MASSASPAIEEAEREYQQAFALAKKALTYVGTFRTPPTPDVYEVWYRFAEGENIAIREQLTFAIDVARSVDRKKLEQLRAQFLSRTDPAGNEYQVSEQLAVEILHIKSAIQEQLYAGNQFDGSLKAANDEIARAIPSITQVQSSILHLKSANSEMRDRLQTIDSKLQKSQQEVLTLQLELNRAHKAMLHDPLTGIGNRRMFDQLLPQAVSHRHAASMGAYLVLIDLDNLKEINDSHGHSTGDAVLKFVASLLSEDLASAQVTRYGGDEFAAIVNRCTPDKVVQLANTICKSISRHETRLSNNGDRVRKVSVSIGGARLRQEDTNETWFARADKLLYDAKRSGRNCAMVERRI